MKRIEGLNGVTHNLETVCRSCVTEYGVLTLYSYNPSADNWTFKRLDCALRNVKDKQVFAGIIAREWYEAELSRANALVEKLVANEESGMNEDERKELANARAYVEEVKKACDVFKNAPVAVGFAKAVACARRNAKTEEYPAGVNTAAAAILAQCEKGTSEGKALREAVQAMCDVLAVGEDDAHMNEYRYNATAQLARDVYRRAYSGRRINGNGRVTKGKLVDKAIVMEIVLTMIEDLQRKEENRRQAEIAKKADEANAK